MHAFKTFSRLIHWAQLRPCYITAANRVLCVYGSKNEKEILHNKFTIRNLSKLTRGQTDEDEVDSHTLKYILYPGARDALMTELEQCDNHFQIFNIIESKANIERRHYIQSILLLWKLIRSDNNIAHDIIHHDVFRKTLAKLQALLPDMDVHELSCCYLYLRKMEVPNVHSLMTEMLIKAITIAKNDVLIELPALSRLVVGINTGKDFCVPLVCQHFWPHIIAHAKTCDTDKAARLVTICILNVKRLACIDTMYMFKERVKHLLQTDILNEKTPKTLVTLIQFFNMPNWSDRNTKLISELMLLLQSSFSMLSDNELRNVCRTYQYQNEPASINDALSAAIKARFEENPTLESLSNYIGFVKPTQRPFITTTLRKMLGSKDIWNNPNASNNFFVVLRSLKIADVNICNKYWEGVIEELNASTGKEKQTKFQKHSHNYMNFNNNLGGTYRNTDLEKTMCDIAMGTLEGDIASKNPSKFARIAAFVFAYGHTPYSWKKFPNIIISKIISMAPQFSIADCHIISRGLQIAMELRFRHNIPPLINMQLSVIDNILITCAENHLNSKDEISITELNAIVRTLAIRKSLRNSVVYQQALNKYGELDYSAPDCFNSRIFRDMCYNFYLSNFCIPKALNAMCEYVERNYESITGDTTEKLITLIYHLGYNSQISKDLLKRASDIFLRDFEQMNGLSLIHACMSLSYLNEIPEELIDRVFCTKFIQRIEDDIQSCYSKATYPERVQNMIMQLNRTVCLDWPEMNVPWFQQNFLEAQLGKARPSNTKFKEEVKRLLQTILNGDRFFHCNHTTPYGYQIDFVIYFDRDKKPISKPMNTNMLGHINKVAILLLKLDAFCENDYTMLRGVESLKIKHLEMMGYKVLHLSEHDWNSKYMSTIGVKLNHLRSLLQISDS